MKLISVEELLPCLNFFHFFFLKNVKITVFLTKNLFATVGALRVWLVG